MTSSIRERLLQGVMTVLAPVALAQGALLIRSPPVGVTREQSPALLFFPESDNIVARPNDRVERHLVIRLTALARDQGGLPAHDIADQLLVAAHAALFAQANFGGLVLGLQELECEWDAEDADATAIAIPARYQISYRTLVSDLSQQG
jgi:hypothetical protein